MSRMEDDIDEIDEVTQSLTPKFQDCRQNRHPRPPLIINTISSPNTSMDISNHSLSSFGNSMHGRSKSKTGYGLNRIQYILDDSTRSREFNDDFSTSVASTTSIRSGESVGSIVTSLLQSARDNSSHGVPSNKQIKTEVVSDMQLVRLVRVLFSRNRGIPSEYSQGNSMARRLSEVFTFPAGRAPTWLCGPLYEGLLKGGDLLNIAVSPPRGAQGMPILTWLCQWMTLKELFHWKGADDMVSLVLAAGADPNIRMKNGSTPLFFAVKYGCLNTVELLVESGADLTMKDRKGRSCLWNALERPQPDIIRFLLEVLPADEKYPYSKRSRRKACHQTAVDYLFAAQLSLAFDAENNPEYPWSWQVLGQPSEDSIADILIEFGKRGVSFTANDITVSLLSFILRGDDPNRRRYRYPNYSAAKSRLERLADLMIGRWLPESQRDRVKNKAMPQPDLQNICAVCNEGMSEFFRPRLRLYCGHDFCLGCILGRGDGSNLDLTCPVCKKQLCLELTGSSSRRQICLTKTYGQDWDGYHGPNVLTSQQLRTECQAREITTRFRDDEKLRFLLKDSMQKLAYHGMEKFDLNTNVFITDGLSDTSLFRPVNGPVALPIIVKGIPITAFISATSAVTLLSPEFVELFGLQKLGVESEKLHNLFGRASCEGTQTMIDQFHFQIGEISICLRNTLESPLPKCIGVQLGLDFFKSGAWCVIDANIEANLNQPGGMKPYISFDGFGNVCHTNSRRKEELRYYSHIGKSFRTELLHLQPFSDGSLSNWISVDFSEKIMECNWCGRIFPEGFIRCEECEDEGNIVYYCTKVCQEAVKEIHTVKHSPEISIDFPK